VFFRFFSLAIVHLVHHRLVVELVLLLLLLLMIMIMV